MVNRKNYVDLKIDDIYILFKYSNQSLVCIVLNNSYSIKEEDIFEFT